MAKHAQTERVDWLCGCGNGFYGIPEDEVPAQCGWCGTRFPLTQNSTEEDE